MLDEEKNKQKGILEHNPLLVFIWAAFPIVTLFGITLGSTSSNGVESTSSMSIFALSVAQFLSVLIILILPAFILAYLYKKDVWSFFNLRKLPSLKMVLLSLGVIIAGNMFLNLLTDLNALIPLPEALATKFNLMHEAAINGQKHFLAFNSVPEFLVVFLVMAIVPAITEEIYFRGLLEGSLLDLKLAPIHAIFISSFLFAMIHFEFYYLLPLLFMGLTLGYIYYRTKNLWLSIIAHFFNNGLIVVLTATNKAELTSVDLEASPAMYISIIGIVMFAGLIYLFHKETTNSKF